MAFIWFILLFSVNQGDQIVSMDPSNAYSVYLLYSVVWFGQGDQIVSMDPRIKAV
jgi:hypothetical protein